MDLDNSQLYINRELSWLEFNSRVLAEAADKKNKLLEQIKFISIVSSNLEEFFMVRVAALIHKKETGAKVYTPDGLNIPSQLKLISESVKKLLVKQYELFYNRIVPLLKNNGIKIAFTVKDAEPWRKILKSIFEEEILPILTPISLGPSHPFPNLLTGRLYLAASLKPKPDNETLIEKSKLLSFVEVPTNIQGRFISVDKGHVFIPLENVIKMFIGRLYHGFEVESAHIIKISRDADFTIEEDEISDLLKAVESTVKRMHQRSVIKLEYEKGLPVMILNTIIAKNHLKKKDTYEIKGLLNLNDLMELYNKLDTKDMKEEPLLSLYKSEFEEYDTIFDAVSEKDFIMFHPYNSYDPVVELINQAADDKNVLAIKQLLYRTSSNSSIIKALIRAAENGKYVTAVVELTARFDEKRNIEWTKKLQDAGAHVIYGIVGLKIHAKALLIVRKEKNEIKKYAHLATGNYNETTARLYTDFSLMTSENSICEDISSLFNLLTGFSVPEQWNCVAISPLDLRKKFLNLIERETQNAKNGIKSKIIAKMNSLNDAEIVKALYAASMAGVKIELIIRGICILRPELKKISHNIKVKSIIGRFLEHARVYYFFNGGDEELFLSSADWMSRNLDRRVEALFPVHNEECRKTVMKVLKLQWEDTVNSWYLNPDGNYKPPAKKNKAEHNCFKSIYSLISKDEKKFGSDKKTSFVIRRSPDKKNAE